MRLTKYHLKNKQTNRLFHDDDNTAISPVFEMRIGVNEFDHRTLVLFK